MVREIDLGNGGLGVSTFPGETGNIYAKIEYYRGKDVSVSIPESFEEAPVTAIGKKAFLGAKTLTKISLPKAVSSIGDYAFASCSSLKELEIPGGRIEYGIGVFKDCGKLERIVRKSGPDTDADLGDAVAYMEADLLQKDLPYLLALSVTRLDAMYLLEDDTAGSPEWFERLDGALTLFLGKDDSEGFSKMLLCGEEDYVGDESNLDTYCLIKKKEKVRALFTRLLHDAGLSEANKKVFAGYMMENMDHVVWPLLLDEHGEDKEYFDLLIDIGCIGPENVSSLIESMGDRYTTMKGYLIRYKGETGEESSFFDDMEL
ncbi:MAG: leucine-rich repeat domain-containing protein [Lachnospiraceae bacterium]|nr:leucine-rich repeat domain-containing protein [Lachnospiraceae bacterium]